MKHSIEIVLDPYLEASIDNALTELEETIDRVRQCDLQGISTYVEIDIDEVLTEHKAIAQIWRVADVRNVRPDLSPEQAWEVLRRCREDLDPLHGLCLDDIKRVASEKFGLAGDRLVKSHAVIDSYGDDLPESNLIALLADAIHWCRAYGHDFASLVATAQSHFQSETDQSSGGDV